MDMKRIALLVTALFLTLPILVHAELLEVTVETPGMLSYQISQKTDWKTVTDLKVNGNLNGTDFLFLKIMSNGYILRKYTKNTYDPISNEKGNLKYLDLTDANIVDGGKSFARRSRKTELGWYDYDEITTENNTTGFNMFGDLETLILPRSLKKVLFGSFVGTSLKTLTFTGDEVKEIPDKTLCRDIDNLTLPRKLEVIGHRAISCKNTLDGSLFSNVWYVGERGVDAKVSATESGFLKLRYVGDEAFSEVSFPEEVKTLTLPSAIYIGNRAFGSDMPVENLDITFTRKNLTKWQEDSIGNAAFSLNIRSKSLKTVSARIGEVDNCDTINFVDFRGCRNLERIDIPDGQYIVAQPNCFDDCESLKSLKLKYLTNCFKNCTSLETLSFKCPKVVEVSAKGSSLAETISTCRNLKEVFGPGFEEVEAGGYVENEAVYVKGSVTSRLIHVLPMVDKWVVNRRLDNPAEKSYHNEYVYSVTFTGCDNLTKVVASGSEYFPALALKYIKNLTTVEVTPESGFVMIDGIVYRKNEDGSAGDYVCYPPMKDDEMPETFVLDKSCEPYAFMGTYPNLKKLVITKNVKYVTGFMPNTQNLTVVECQSQEPPTVGGRGSETLCQLYDKLDKFVLVPKGAGDAYLKHKFWSHFNIIEYDSVDDVADGAVVVAAYGRMLMVAGADGQRIDVFSADGRQVYSGTDSSVELPQAGVYVVRTGAVVKKIAVR